MIRYMDGKDIKQIVVNEEQLNEFELPSHIVALCQLS